MILKQTFQSVNQLKEQVISSGKKLLLYKHSRIAFTAALCCILLSVVLLYGSGNGGTVLAADGKTIANPSNLCTGYGWAINVNGETIATVGSKDTAERVLNEIKAQYTTSGSEIISAELKETVTITRSDVRIADLMSSKEAKSFLLTGGTNLTVATKELITTTEPVEFNTVYEETNTLMKGETKIITAGTNGTKEVRSEVTKENGVIVETKIIGDAITTEPQNQVALMGTKSPTLIASRGGGRSLTVNGSGSEIVAYAKQFLGTPYVRGGASPEGFDCSGFTQYVYAKFGAALPRTTTGQFGYGTGVDRSELQPGDLVFFTSSSRISHVGIYVGGGSFIHAPQAGDTVKISSLSSTTLKYCGAVRASNL